MIKQGIASDVGKTTKSLAQQIARQVVNVPYEILKTAGEQAVGQEKPNTGTGEDKQKGKVAQPKVEDQEKGKEKDLRLVQALETEMRDIRRQKKEAEMKKQKEEEAKKLAGQTSKPLVEPTPKKGRNLFNFGRKSQAEREQTRVEKPLPPSG